MTIKKDLTRRSFIKTAAAGASAVAVPMALTGCGADDKNKNVSTADSKLVVAFGHGVASGDPLSDRVIIWTRVTHSEASSKTVPVDWVVATDAAMTDVVASGSAKTKESSDYTLKVDVDGLSANTTYYYQFTGPLAVTSVIGQTKTLPVGYVEKVKFAVCSCANYPAGFFNVYQAMSKSDADVVLHLGDYIYEYGEGEYGDARVPAPATEITSLADYRTRYSQYRIDEQAQSVHRVKPFICVWDDHEVANDTYKDGAANHNDGEGDFETRKEAAFQAYHEWMPIRTGTDKEIIYRNFKFGELLSLNMMDTRHIARDKPLGFTELLTAAASSSEEAAALIADPARRLIGDEQLSWLIAEWTNSTTTWEVLGQQVLMGRIMAPSEMLLPIAGLQAKLEADSTADVTAEQIAVNTAITELYSLKLAKNAGATLSDTDEARLASVAPYNLDAWDGYFVEREQILARAPLMGKNVISLAGDTHNAWASDLRYVVDTTTGALSEKSVGVEFATSSVSSPGFDQYLSLSGAQKIGFESAITALVEDLRYMDASRRGFMEVTFTPEHATSEWVFSDITTKPAAGDDVATDSNYLELAADGATPVAKKSKFRVYPYSSGRSDANSLIPVTD
jgi:alkaline phosphatase D